NSDGITSGCTPATRRHVGFTATDFTCSTVPKIQGRRGFVAIPARQSFTSPLLRTCAAAGPLPAHSVAAGAWPGAVVQSSLFNSPRSWRPCPAPLPFLRLLRLFAAIPIPSFAAFASLRCLPGSFLLPRLHDPATFDV